MPRTFCDQCAGSWVRYGGAAVFVHERGCPRERENAECEWCGQEFKREVPSQRFCDDDCARAWTGD